MGETRIRIEEGILSQIEDLARSHNRSIDEEVNDLLRSLVDKPTRESFYEKARRISAMTPKGVEQIDSVEMLREDRSR